MPKEGSLFEDGILVEYLGKFDNNIANFVGDIEANKTKRDEISNLMKALVYFEYVIHNIYLIVSKFILIMLV